MKVKIINKAGYAVTVDMPAGTRLYPHFTLKELANNLGSKWQPQMILSPDQDDLLMLIEELRKWYGKPMTCNSCYRQPAFNAKVKGDKNSLHLKALAFDWGIHYTDALDKVVVEKWREITKKAGKIGGINLEPYGYHLDANEEHFGHNSFVIRNYR